MRKHLKMTAVSSLALLLCLGLGCESEPDAITAADLSDGPLSLTEIEVRDFVAPREEVLAAAYDVVNRPGYRGIQVMSREGAFSQPTVATRAPRDYPLPLGEGRTSAVRTDFGMVTEAPTTLIVQSLTPEVTRVTLRMIEEPGSTMRLTVMDQIEQQLAERMQGTTSTRSTLERGTLYGSSPSQLRQQAIP